MKKVSKGIYRSGRPTYEDLKLNQSSSDFPIKTIINLEDDSQAFGQEIRWSDELGIQFILNCLSEVWRPNQKKLQNILLDMRVCDKPVLIHCKHGHERTGIVIAYYRMKVEGWSKWKAIKEALKEGFSPFYLWWFI